MESVSDAFAIAAEEIEARDGTFGENENPVPPPLSPERSLDYSSDDDDSDSGTMEEEAFDDVDPEQANLSLVGESPDPKVLDWSKPDGPDLKEKVKYDRKSKAQKVLLRVIEDNQSAVGHNADQAAAMYIKACKLAKLGETQEKLLNKVQAANVKNRKIVKEAEKVKSNFVNAKKHWSQKKSVYEEKVSKLKAEKKKAQADAKEFRDKVEKLKKQLQSAENKYTAKERELSKLTTEKTTIQLKCDNATGALAKAEEELKKYKNEEFSAMSRQNKRIETEQHKQDAVQQRNNQRTNQLARATGGNFRSSSSILLPQVQVRCCFLDRSRMELYFVFLPCCYCDHSHLRHKHHSTHTVKWNHDMKITDICLIVAMTTVLTVTVDGLNIKNMIAETTVLVTTADTTLVMTSAAVITTGMRVSNILLAVVKSTWRIQIVPVDRNRLFVEMKTSTTVLVVLLRVSQWTILVLSTIITLLQITTAFALRQWKPHNNKKMITMVILIMMEKMNSIRTHVLRMKDFVPTWTTPANTTRLDPTITPTLSKRSKSVYISY